MVVLCCSPAAADIDWGELSFTPIHQMQSLENPWTVPTPDGVNQAYKLRGIVLNDPALMLDSAAAFSVGPAWNMGAQWQIYVQAVDRLDNPTELAGDFGGVALWMGQNYGNHTYKYGTDLTANAVYSYSDTEWDAEMDRLNYPNGATEALRPGDLIEIHARGAKEHNGKYNCNEEHDKSAEYDFDIFIVARDQPLPLAEISLENVKNINDESIVDTTRQSGGEFYQGQRVVLKNVSITNPTAWGAYGDLNVTDGVRNFAVKLGDNDSFDGTSAPSGLVDITGIFDQEGDYRMWALTPDAFAAVPEPGTALLLVVGSLMFIVLRKRR